MSTVYLTPLFALPSGPSPQIARERAKPLGKSFSSRREVAVVSGDLLDGALRLVLERRPLRAVDAPPEFAPSCMAARHSPARSIQACSVTDVSLPQRSHASIAGTQTPTARSTRWRPCAGGRFFVVRRNAARRRQTRQSA